MTRLAARHPILFSVSAVLMAVILIKLLDAGLAYLNLSDLAHRLIVEAVFVAYVAALLTGLRWWTAAGFQQLATGRRLAACLPLLVLPGLLALSSGFKTASLSQIFWFTLLTVLVGLAEEGLVRGVVLHALLPIGLARAAGLSALLFGLGHLVNLWQGAAVSATVVQIIYATFLGIGFAGARAYTGSIWPAIAIHTLIDFVDGAGRGFVLAPQQSVTMSGVIVTIVITGLFALYGWWLLRRTTVSLPA